MLNLTYFSPKVEKRASLIDGRGLFATAGASVATRPAARR
jgi:hypothetical protein